MSRLRKAVNKSASGVSTKSIKKYVNSLAPQGFKYDEEKKGIFILKPNERKDFTFTLKSSMPKINGMEIKPENLFDALYATQTPFDATNAIVEINGKEGKATELLIRDIKGEGGKFYLYPPPFPKIEKSFVLTVGGEKIDFKIKRIPFNSFTCHKFESYEPEYMLLILTYTIETEKLVMKLTRDLNKIRYMEDVVRLKNILIGFDKGDFQLDGKEVELEPRKSEENLGSMERLVYVYEKIVELQNIFDVKFENEFNFTSGEALLAKKLYISFIMNKFHYEDVKKDDIHNIVFEKITPEMKEGFDKGDAPFVLMAQQAYKNIFFKAEIEYVEMIIFHNVSIVGIDEEDMKVSFKLNDDGYVIKRYFKEVKDKDVYFDKLIPENRDDIIDLDNLDW